MNSPRCLAFRKGLYSVGFVAGDFVRRGAGGGDGQGVRSPLAQELILDRLRRGRASFGRVPYAPTELKTYSGWHQTLDELVWLLKVTYATPEALRKRRFRLDTLFAGYIKKNKLAIPAMRRALRSPTARRWRRG